ncbi:MAG: hypothetical protein DLM53_11925 [Candidatus Eremiobacter antarcticus]|nr:two pore domain potassium channel family protein [Candidatus Eremiobacteraeota bacterium]MBC5808955.1 two pore domain potassium channel family protein [Candidatus Eremiobacteraeota bacterium]PZR60365.1 MAG: hypothetical protein DLM53_11925 [Candidatus Eremiobacter sp. RRmetagenome_bin22]
MIVTLILIDVFASVVVPRAVRWDWRVSPRLIRYAWAAWRSAGLRMQPAERQDAFLAMFAPFNVILLLIVWLIALIFGYALMFYGLRSEMRPPLGSLGDAAYFAGTALLTIGFGDIVATAGPARFFALSAGAAGLGTVAIVLTFLFSLFASFQRREVFVVTLDARGGAPASGVSLLETHAGLLLVDDLPDLFKRGQEWAAEVLDTHLAYPILAFFRSSHVDVSWLAALGAMLDASTLIISSIEGVPRGQAVLMHNVGSHLTNDIAKYFRVNGGPNVGVEFGEYESARQRLAAAGYALVNAQEGWATFQRLRVEYSGQLNAMATYWAIVPAQWIGDRSPIERRHADG